MYRTIAVPLLASIACSVAAQAPARPEPAKASKPASPLVYESVFAGYRPFVDPDVARWREVNDDMARLGGHVGHLPGSLPPRGATPSAKPPAQPGHGGHK